MKVLKAILCLALTALIPLLPAISITASADGETSSSVKRYAYADLDSEVYFCKEKQLKSALFIIPQTYCVEILGKEEGWYYVKYAEDTDIYRAVFGYCLVDEVVPIDEPLENLFLHQTITVTYKTDQTAEYMPPPENIVVRAAYYGAYATGKTKCSYVYCNESFGYVADTIESYPLNELPAKTTGAPVAEGGVNVTLITAVAVTAVAAAAIAVLYFSGKKPPKNGEV